jgi:gamma-tubulin complex component 5
MWTDFHFLNSAFNDAVATDGSKHCISAPLVRLAYRGKDKPPSNSVKGIDGLLIEYAIPFPLTYIFTPKTLQIYGSIFVWLLQVRRAKSVLERILVRDKVGGHLDEREELKVFYAMRSRLSWFVK